MCTVDLTSIFGGVGDAFAALEDFFSALIDPHTYVRLFFIVIGAALVLTALTYGR